MGAAGTGEQDRSGPAGQGSALLVVDVQRGVVEGNHDVDGVVSRIVGLVDRARDEGVPVVWVQHSSDEGLPAGSDGWQLREELAPAEGEPVVHKRYGDSFESTDLQEQLERLGVGRLVVTGAQTDMCIRSTLHGALARGYDATLVGDAHTTEDTRQWGGPLSPEQAIAYTNFYWTEAATEGHRGDVSTAAEVSLRTPRTT